MKLRRTDKLRLNNFDRNNKLMQRAYPSAKTSKLESEKLAKPNRLGKELADSETHAILWDAEEIKFSGEFLVARRCGFLR